MNTCSIVGCEKATRTRGSEWCAMHYHRWYRHGDPLVTFENLRTAGPGKYRLVSAAGHPVRPKCGRAYEHRVVLYDTIGADPQPCHWCGCTVHWFPEATESALEVDHLNSVRDDNRPENLVPSCGTCNGNRARKYRRLVALERGAWAAHDTVGQLKVRVTDLLDHLEVGVGAEPRISMRA